MGRKLINPKANFRPVYSLYMHELLGVIVSSHIVRELENGRLSMEYQGLHPNNFDHFAHRLDDRDRKLVKLCHEISPKEIIKKYEPKESARKSFFKKKYSDQIKDLIDEYLTRRVAQIMELLPGKEVYVMSSDEYPAYREVNMLEDKATVLFHFRRNEDNTHYFPTIKLGGVKIDFSYSHAIIVCTKPAWILLDYQLFTFQKFLDGKKLRPFLKRKFIAINRDKEDIWLRKFVASLIEEQDVYAKGFEITPVNEPPKFELELNSLGSDAVNFKLKARYGTFSVPVNVSNPIKVVLKRDGDEYTFFRIRRNINEEKRIEKLVSSLRGDGSLLNWDFMEKQVGLGWLSHNLGVFEENNIAIIQNIDGLNLNFSQPKIILETTENGDWFDINALVKIGKFEIPFSKFRKNILQGIREFVLPDGTVAILPDSWFSDYRHLIEIAEERADGKLSIKRYQAALLTFNGGVLGNMKEKLRSLVEVDQIDAIAEPKKLKATLRSYQKEGYNWLNFLREHHFGGILADDMGLGKTLQTLSLIQRNQEEGSKEPTLVIMPTSLIYNWQQESKKFTPWLKILVYTGLNRNKDPKSFMPYDLILSTYGTVRQDIDTLKDFPFNYVILDESQMIKNPASKTNKAICKLTSRFRLSLTGTPLENTLMDLWSQMSFLNPGLLGNETFFRNFYVNPIEKEQDERKMTMLKKLINPFILRRTKLQVAKDLPPKVEAINYCEMDEAQSKLYDEVKSTYRNYLMDLFTNGEFKNNKLHVLAGLQKLRQIAIHPQLVEEGKDLPESAKFEEMLRMLEDIVSSGSKVLIFSQFVKFLDIIKGNLDEQGINYSWLTGKTRNRQEQVDQFQNDPKIQVFLISLKAGGVGLNLTAAEYVFILDPWWNPAVEAQAIDRSHRIGQEKTVFSYKFITKGTIEEKILKLQERKSKLSKEIVSIEKDVFKKLNKEDLLELID